MHRWVVAFCKLNGMQLHEGKTLYIGRTETQDQVPDGIISINSVPILAVPLGMSVRYLGAQIAMDLKTMISARKSHKRLVSIATRRSNIISQSTKLSLSSTPTSWPSSSSGFGLLRPQPISRNSGTLRWPRQYQRSLAHLES
jgi:hypothetical protein